MKIRPLIVLLFLLLPLCGWSSDGVVIREAEGWLESGSVTWNLLPEAAGYRVFIAPDGGDYRQIDPELVRDYGSYGRADMVGLCSGCYRFRVVPVDGQEAVLEELAAETEPFYVAPHDRSGYAHFGFDGGVGAYNDDGTLKDGAKVLYVWADNAKTISTDVIYDKKGTRQTFTGLQQIIYGYQKGFDTTPLAIRLIGTIREEDMDELLSSAEGLQVKGKGAHSTMNITIEGIGDDATIWGFGILLRNCRSVELRNFGIMLCRDDCVSIDTDNSHLWLHHLDLYYGKTGGDSDQAKGDGTIDVKGDSQYITIAANHFVDTGKSSLCGMSSESGPNWISYHHNWFDHSDSRHPRIRTMSVHIWNNYFDGVSKYGVGVTSGGNAFVEGNYFRNCKCPMLISQQGSDPEGSAGTFSSEDGGMIKAYGNAIVGSSRFVPHTQNATSFDAYVATERGERVPDTCRSVHGAFAYSNFDTDTTLIYSYASAPADSVPFLVTGALGAGRMAHGDFHWTFNDAKQDTNYDVIAELKEALQEYRSSLVGFFGTPIRNGGGTPVIGGDGDEGDEEEEDTEEMPWLAGPNASDYFFFNGDNAKQVEALIADGTIVLENATFQPEYTDAKNNRNVYVGSLQAVSGTGTVTFHCPRGISTFVAYMYRTGSFKGEVQVSSDGVSFRKVYDYSGSKYIQEADFSSYVRTTDNVWVRITNTSTGGLNIQGVRILYPRATGIEVVADGKESAVYDLAGRIVSADGTRHEGLQPGIYVSGGRKMLIR